MIFDVVIPSFWFGMVLGLLTGLFMFLVWGAVLARKNKT